MIEIKGEADGSELRKVISAFSRQAENRFVTDKDIDSVLDLLPQSIGYWLKNSTPLADGSYRGEMHNGFIITARLKPELVGIAFGHDFNEPEHYDLHIKFEGSALDAIGQELSSPAKNG